MVLIHVVGDVFCHLQIFIVLGEIVCSAPGQSPPAAVVNEFVTELFGTL